LPYIICAPTAIYQFERRKEGLRESQFTFPIAGKFIVRPLQFVGYIRGVLEFINFTTKD
jgi:hypothetical protein